MMRFAERTNWRLEPNLLARAITRARESGRALLDLTESNPTRCGLPDLSAHLAEALRGCLGVPYTPDPLGLPRARAAVEEYYARRGVVAPLGDMALFASTSEAYCTLFRLLCNPGDAVLAPAPSYPLLPLLGRMQDVEVRPYELGWDGSWWLDFDALERAASERVRAIVVVSPNNPTGHWLRASEAARLDTWAAERGWAVLVDEVFADYPTAIAPTPRFVQGPAAALWFGMSGLSKVAALPQLKLAWARVFGPPSTVRDAMERLELMGDVMLSVGSPVQQAASSLFALGDAARADIQARLDRNRRHVHAALAHTPATVLPTEGGWVDIIQLPRLRTDEEWVQHVIERWGLIVHPGYFYDFQHEATIVASALTVPEVYDRGVEALRMELDAC